MNWIAIVVALAACGVSVCSFFARKPDEKTVKALAAAKEEIAELGNALVHLVDGEGNIRARLALPAEGQTLASQRRDINAAKEEMMALRKEIRESKAAKEQIEGVLVEVLDADNEVLHSIRVPGEKKNPNLTPCGKLCKRAFWITNKPNADAYNRATNGFWYCNAFQGYACNNARPHFLNGQGQCAMFVLNESQGKDDDE